MYCRAWPPALLLCRENAPAAPCLHRTDGQTEEKAGSEEWAAMSWRARNERANAREDGGREGEAFPLLQKGLDHGKPLRLSRRGQAGGERNLFPSSYENTSGNGDNGTDAARAAAQRGSGTGGSGRDDPAVLGHGADRAPAAARGFLPSGAPPPLRGRA